jgi:prevent-host-death family protein
MLTLNIHEAKTHLSKLIERVENGDEVIIAKAGKPVARLVPIAGVPIRRPGSMKGKFIVPDDFDAPLPDEILATFNGPA